MNYLVLFKDYLVLFKGEFKGELVVCEQFYHIKVLSILKNERKKLKFITQKPRSVHLERLNNILLCIITRVVNL